MKRYIVLTVALVFVAVGNLLISPASADELTWRIKSEHPKVVSLSFYSEDRNRAWPGGDEVYVLEDWETHTFSLSCNTGEKICFGAWVRNKSRIYWGTGYNNENSCKNCCWRCGQGDVQTQVLTP